MVPLGLLIIIAVAAVVVVMVLRGDDSVNIDLDALGTVRTDASIVFLVGALTLLIGVLGVVILLAGLRRGRRQRAELRALKDRARADAASRPAGGGGTERYDDDLPDGGETPGRSDR